MNKETSQLLYLDLSKFDEIYNDMHIQILVELFHYYELINKNHSRKGYYKTVPNIFDYRLLIYNDSLSIEKIQHIVNRIYSTVTHSSKVKFVGVIFPVLKKNHQGIGYLNNELYLLVLIYTMYHPGLL